MRLWIAGIVGLLLIGGSVLAQEVAPLGGQFQVNAYTTESQRRAQVGSDGQGSFVVVWNGPGSGGTDTSGSSVQARRFKANGTPVGTDFQVNTYTEGYQDRPEVAVNSSGEFVVVWDTDYSDGPDTTLSIQGQRFDGTGSAVGNQFEVNAYTTSTQILPRVALDSLGKFVVVWHSLGSYGTDNHLFSVEGQRFDDSGTPQGSQFQVNSFTTNYQITASVGAADDGDFVVVWQSKGSYGSDTSQWSVQAQRFHEDGSLDGGQFQVNSYTTSHQDKPALAVDGQGGFVVAWQSDGSYGTDNSGWSIQAQRFDTAGTKVGNQFQVNSYTTQDQYKPSVDIDDQGAFIVTWESEGSAGTDSSDLSVQAQVYDPSGKPVGGQFQVNSYTTSGQGAPSVSSIDSEGNFVIVWESRAAFDDTSYWSVQAQRFASRPVLVDNFESGDMSAWSNVVQ